MIFIKGQSLVDILVQLKGAIEISKTTITPAVNQNPDEIIIRVPIEYKGRNIFIFFDPDLKVENRD